MLDVLLKDDNWFLPSAAFSLMAALVLVIRARQRHVTRLLAATGACNLFFGLLIGILGTGHLFGVTTKTVLGSLPEGIRLWFAIPFGFALAVPAWWLAWKVKSIMSRDPVSEKRAIGLNAWLTLVLASAGPAIVLASLAGVNIVLLVLQLRARPLAGAS